MPRRDRDRDDRYEDDDQPPPRPRRKTNNLPLVLALAGGGALLTVVVCVGGLYLVGSGARKQAELEAEAARTAQLAPAAPARPTEVVDAENGAVITNDFTANPISAEQKWIGKRVRIKTAVTQIDRDRRGFYVGLYHVFVYPAQDQLPKFGALRRDDRVEVETTLVRFRTGDLAAGRFPQVEGEDGVLIATHGSMHDPAPDDKKAKNGR